MHLDQSLGSSTRPDRLLRAEALAALVLAASGYEHFFAGHWLFFALLFLVPDLSLLTFVKGPTAFASALYNIVHTSTIPLVLGLLAWHEHWTLALQCSLIWLAHIAVDRVLGFGLKYPGSFKQTHLQTTAGLAHLAN